MVLFAANKILNQYAPPHVTLRIAPCTVHSMSWTDVNPSHEGGGKPRVVGMDPATISLQFDRKSSNEGAVQSCETLPTKTLLYSSSMANDVFNKRKDFTNIYNNQKKI